MRVRQLTSHKINDLNQAIKIEVLSEVASVACSTYLITVKDLPECLIKFHKGPVDSPNGISNEALLAIVEDRLKGFQSGKFACRENALALTHLQEAMHWLHHRTRERIVQGVEGTNAVHQC